MTCSRHSPPVGVALGLLALVAAGPLRAQEVDGTAGDEGQDEGAAQIDDAGAGAAPHAESLLGEAGRILAAARSTSYSHRTRIDEASRRFDVDCSGFAGYVLRRAAPAARRELVGATVRRPLARDFVGFIEALPAGARRGHWRRVEWARDLRPGDLIAWLRPADSRSKDTGHVMLVAGAAIGEGRDLEVPIIDSSALRHGEADRRAAGARTGIGTGTIVLRLDGRGRAVGFRWAPERRYHLHETEIVVGRVEPQP